MTDQIDIGVVHNHAKRFYSGMYHSFSHIITPLLFIGGLISVIFGLVSMTVSITTGSLLRVGGVGALSIARLLDLLMDIESHLAAIRIQTGKGIFSLLG